MKKLKRILTYTVIVMIALLNALSYQLFVFPNRFAPSGLNGICTMLQYIFHINAGYLNLIINVPLAFLVFAAVGHSLAVRSLVYSGSFSLGLIVLEKIDLSGISYETANGTSLILGPLIAGVITGLCTAVLIRCSACTGGMDFVAAILHRKLPNTSFFAISFGLNTVVAGMSYFVYDFQIEPVILCIMYTFMASTVSDKLMKSGLRAVRCEIITDNPDELSDALIKKLHHSVTLIPATGMYKSKPTNILICIVNKSQMASVTEVIRDFPNTFAAISQVSEVVGNFKHLDTNGNPEKDLLDKGDGRTV